jgi:hypothetical protein
MGLLGKWFQQPRVIEPLLVANLSKNGRCVACLSLLSLFNVRRKEGRNGK